jgi:hypothetical protein
LSHFSLVKPRPQSTFSQCLYVLHRDSVDATLGVRWAKQTDAQSVFALAHGLQNSHDIMSQFELCISDLLFRQAMQDELTGGGGGGGGGDGGASGGGGGNAAPEASEVSSAAFVAHCRGQVVGLVITQAMRDTDVYKLRFG